MYLIVYIFKKEFSSVQTLREANQCCVPVQKLQSERIQNNNLCFK